MALWLCATSVLYPIPTSSPRRREPSLSEADYGPLINVVPAQAGTQARSHSVATVKTR